MLLQVLQERDAAVDLQLGALYVLRCLAQERPGAVPLLKLHSAVRTLQRLLQQDKLDCDVQHGAASLLRALGVSQPSPPQPARQQPPSHGSQFCRRSTEGGVQSHNSHSAPDYTEQQRRRALGSSEGGAGKGGPFPPLLGGGCLRGPLPPTVPAAVCQ